VSESRVRRACAQKSFNSSSLDVGVFGLHNFSISSLFRSITFGDPKVGSRSINFSIVPPRDRKSVRQLSAASRCITLSTVTFLYSPCRMKITAAFPTSSPLNFADSAQVSAETRSCTRLFYWSAMPAMLTFALF
jgi:hypothetical protein